jgi:glycerophosphoryl diester phosphodiesterase
MKVIAHRGASGELPENTLPAYRRAVAQRADMIEIDLHRTRDGAIPITHDATLAHLGGRGEIADATLAEVRALDAGGGERVPLLHEVLDEFGPQIPLNLELKVGRSSAADCSRRRSSPRSTTRCSPSCARAHRLRGLRC